MNTQTLLIADSNEDFQLTLAEALQGRYRVLCCTNGKEALAILRKEHCDILVLDLTLPELDGISLLQAAVEEGIYPMVLATTPFTSSYVLDAVNRLGVGYLMRKPCDVQAIAARIADLNHCLHPPIPDSRTFVSVQLLLLGICIKHDGYAYLQESILLMADNPRQAVTKELYPAVAAIFGCKGRLVERSIRSALDAAWKHRDIQVWQSYFPPSTKRPTNTVFITRLAESLRLRRANGLVSGEVSVPQQPFRRRISE